MGDVAGAERYFTFATVEDLISRGGDLAGLDTPASQTLRVAYRCRYDYFEALAARLDALRSTDAPDDTLKLQNPELLFIEPSGTVEIGPPADESE